MHRHNALAATFAALAATWVLTGGHTVVARTPSMQAPCESGGSSPKVPSPPSDLRIIRGEEAAFDPEFPSGPNGEFDAADENATVAQTGPHAYFNALSLRPDCQFAYSLRTQAQIDQRKFGSYAPKVNYDSATDAAKWQWGTNDGPSAQQIRLPISLIRPTSGSSKLLIVSDHMWDDKWFTEFMTATGRLQGWKWLQVTGNTSAGGTNENIWFEPQMRFVGWDAGIVSWFAVRGYQSVRPPTLGGLGSETGQSICGKNFGEVLGPMLNCFQAKAFTWTRVWIEVVETAGDDYARLSIWMADETQNAMPILRNAEMWSNGRHSGFWYEYNTSSEGRVGGPMAAYGRNVVVLNNVADPTSVFARPIR